ncbi:MAG: carbohydrate-binding protein [Oscillospiraceae bacterium]|nr:carbohydrate-binding protein [Oscillospiraceae bacterium]
MTRSIYTIGQMPGTVINENYVQGIPAGGFGSPTYGLHNDDGTAWIEEFDNVLDIDKNVTYTINCEDFGIKRHHTIKNTYATVNKMGKNPPDCDIDAPIVVADAVWPQKQYEICVRSGLQDEFRSIMPENMMTDADYVFPASCATSGGATIAIRKAGSGKSVWIAPDDTTAFKAGTTMTKASGTADKIKTLKASGEYRIYVTDASGKILSRSQHILRISGSTGDGTAVEAAAFDMQSGVEIENLEEGGRDVGYIENGDYIGFKDVDFKNGAEAMEFRLATPYGGSSIEIRLDAPDGERIGVADVGETGGWHEFKNITTSLPRRPASMTCIWSSRAARAICSTSYRGNSSSRQAPRSA